MVLTAKLRKTGVSITIKFLKILKNQTGTVILCHKFHRKYFAFLGYWL